MADVLRSIPIDQAEADTMEKAFYEFTAIKEILEDEKAMARMTNPLVVDRLITEWKAVHSKYNMVWDYLKSKYFREESKNPEITWSMDFDNCQLVLYK